MKKIIQWIKLVIRLVFIPEDFSNRLSIIKTIYYNFRCLPFSQAVKLPIWIFCGFKISKMGKILLEEVDSYKISGGMVQLGRKTYFARCYKGSFTNYGAIKIKGFLRMDAGGKIVNFGEILFNRSMLSSNVFLSIHGNLQIGQYGRFGAEGVIMDDNFHYIIDTTTGKVNNNKSNITIGDYCWFGRCAFVGKGTVLPDRTIVAANSVINKNYSDLPAYSMISGNPAKLVAQNKARIFNELEENRLNKYFTQNDARDMIVDLFENDLKDLISYKSSPYRTAIKTY